MTVTHTQPTILIVDDAHKRDNSTGPSKSQPCSVRFKAAILLVEDTKINQMVAIAMLEKMGVTITLAENGQQAVERWRDSGADLILMDCNMPVMNGFEATKMIRSEEAPDQHTPIVALTANATRENAQRCTLAGMNAVATKPFSIKDLEQVLSRWLDS